MYYFSFLQKLKLVTKFYYSVGTLPQGEIPSRKKLSVSLLLFLLYNFTNFINFMNLFIVLFYLEKKIQRQKAADYQSANVKAENILDYANQSAPI